MTKHKWIRNQPVNLNELASTSVKLMAANSPKLMLCAWPANGGGKVSLQCNRYESPDWSLFPRDLVLIPDLWLLACVQLFTIAPCSNCSLATYPFFSSSNASEGLGSTRVSVLASAWGHEGRTNQGSRTIYIVEKPVHQHHLSMRRERLLGDFWASLFWLTDWFHIHLFLFI